MQSREREGLRFLFEILPVLSSRWASLPGIPLQGLIYIYVYKEKDPKTKCAKPKVKSLEAYPESHKKSEQASWASRIHFLD